MIQKGLRITLSIIILLSPTLVIARSSKPFRRVILKNSEVILLTPPHKSFVLPRNLVATIQPIFGDEFFVHILSKKGEPLYKTLLTNLTSTTGTTQLTPKIDPLKIHNKKILDIEKLPRHKRDRWSTFVNFGIDQSSSNFFKELFNGEQNRLGSLSGQLRQYYVYHKLPVHLGVHLNTYRQGWSDEIGDASILNVNWGPTLMTSFGGDKKNSYNLHLSFFRSLFSRAKLGAQTVNLTTTGYQIQLEKQFLVKNNPFIIGAHYTYSKHTVDDLSVVSEFIANGNESALGLKIGYRFDWAL